MNRKFQSLFCGFLIAVPWALANTSPVAWKIERATLTSHSQMARSFAASVSRIGQAKTFELSASVPMTKVEDYFVSGNKLAVIGEAGGASAVVVFDLTRRQKTDWFYC